MGWMTKPTDKIGFTVQRLEIPDRVRDMPGVIIQSVHPVFVHVWTVINCVIILTLSKKFPV
jgi:hypothetical protein